MLPGTLQELKGLIEVGEPVRVQEAVALAKAARVQLGSYEHSRKMEERFTALEGSVKAAMEADDPNVRRHVLRELEALAESVETLPPTETKSGVEDPGGY